MCSVCVQDNFEMNRQIFMKFILRIGFSNIGFWVKFEKKFLAKLTLSDQLTTDALILSARAFIFITSILGSGYRLPKLQSYLTFDLPFMAKLDHWLATWSLVWKEISFNFSVHTGKWSNVLIVTFEGDCLNQVNIFQLVWYIWQNHLEQKSWMVWS